MKIKIIHAFFILILFFSFNNLYGQQKKFNVPRHRAGMELLGESFYFSAHYDFRPLKKNNFFIHTSLGYYYNFSNYLSYHLGLYYEAQLINPKHFIQLGVTKSFFDNYAIRFMFFKPDDQLPYFESWVFSVGFLEYFGNNWYWRFRVNAFTVNKELLGLGPTDLEPLHIVILPFFGFTLGKTF